MPLSALLFSLAAQRSKDAHFGGHLQILLSGRDSSVVIVTASKMDHQPEHFDINSKTITLVCRMK